MVHATLHRNPPIDKLIQYRPKKYLLRDTAGRYCPNDHNKRDKKPHKVDHGPTGLL